MDYDMSIKVPPPPKSAIPPPPPKAVVPPPPPTKAVVPPPPPVPLPPTKAVVPPPPPMRLVAPPPPTTIVPPPPGPLQGELMPPDGPKMIKGRLTEACLHNYQRKMVNFAMSNPNVMLWAGLGAGKRMTLSTPILTVNGWKTHGTIEVGDLLVHPKGGTNRVTQVHAIHNEEVYELELKDGRVAECHHEHLWQVDVESVVGSRTDGTRRNRVVSKTFTTAELMSRSYNRYALQRIERIDYPEKQLPIEPYLLGALLADGGLTGPSIILCGHVDDTFIFDKCASLLPEGVTCSKVSNYSGKSARMSIHAGIKPLLDGLGLGGTYSGERFIPKEYLTASFDQRLALLRGLMDCDGSIRSRNRKQYSTTSARLRDDIHELVMTLGGTTSVCTNTRPDKSDSDSIEYNISITFVDVNPFSLPRKADKVIPSTRDRVSTKIKDIRRTGRFEDMRCISTERADGLYIINDYMVTHNTLVTLTAIAKRIAAGEVKKVLLVAPLRVIQLVWAQEADNFHHTHNLRFANMTGTAKKRQMALFSNADVYMTNFESLGWLALQLQTYWINQGYEIPFEMVVWDEISKVKRSESNRFKDFSPMIEHFKYSIGLTASPASNGLHNVWGMFFFLDAGKRLGTDYKEFQSRFFHKLSGNFGKWVAYDNTRDMIIEKVSDMTFEIGIEETGVEMPDFQEIDVMVRLTPKLMKGYLKLENDFEVQLESGEDIEVFNAQALASKLIQYSSGAIYKLPDPEGRPDYRIVEHVHNLKDEALDEIISESGDEPIMLAYNFSSERDRIMAKYPDAKCLTGASEAEAVNLMNQFNSGCLKLLLVHPASSGYGINLQKACSTIVMYGLNYNLEAVQQTIGRVQRQGNKSSKVKCFRILCADTMDEAVADALTHKDAVQSDLKASMNKYLASKGR